MDKQILTDVKKIKSPEGRILIYILITSVTILFGLLMNKGNSNEKGCKAEVKSLQLQVEAKQKELDRVKEYYEYKIDNINGEMLKGKQETIEELKKVLDEQEKLKKSLKKK